MEGLAQDDVQAPPSRAYPQRQKEEEAEEDEEEQL